MFNNGLEGRADSLEGRVLQLEQALEFQTGLIQSMSRSIANHRLILDGLVGINEEGEDDGLPLQTKVR